MKNAMQSKIWRRREKKLSISGEEIEEEWLAEINEEKK
jgi:hypothetical protein